MKQVNHRGWLMLLTGLAMGLLVGVGIAIGVLVTSRTAPEPAAQIELPPALLNATATHGTDTFAIATGPVGEDMEGIFFLDFLTGELQCRMLSARSPRTWVGVMKTNIVKDLGAERAKNPKYLMTTGMANFRGVNGNLMGGCVVYVVDANTGAMAAYGVPWNRARASVDAPQSSPLILLQSGKVRTLKIRE